jgi:dienelactone hydrolase
MKKYTLPFVILCLIYLFSCDPKDKPSVEVEECNIIFPAGTLDTLFYVSSGNLSIPVIMHIPSCGTRPLPAVIVMHGSGGLWSNDIPGTEMASQFIWWKEAFASECVVSVFIDSYSPRGAVENEGDYKVPPKTFEISAQFERPKDAYSALEFLSKIVNENGAQLVDKSKIGILGFSHGGTATESSIFDPRLIPYNWEWTQTFDGATYDVPAPFQKPEELSFAAAVVYYPGSYHNGYYGTLCDETGGYYLNSCPLQMHLAELDPLTENSLCFATSTTQNGGEVEYYIYEGANHSFDNKASGPDEVASNQSRARTMAWFREYLGF